MERDGGMMADEKMKGYGAGVYLLSTYDGQPVGEGGATTLGRR